MKDEKAPRPPNLDTKFPAQLLTNQKEKGRAWPSLTHLNFGQAFRPESLNFKSTMHLRHMLITIREILFAHTTLFAQDAPKICNRMSV